MCPNATPRESSTLGGLTGELPNGYIASYRTPRNLLQISGWNFDNLEITVRQRLCEALYAAGHIKEAGESLLNMANTVDEDVYRTGSIVTWVSGKLCYPIPLTCIRYLAIDFLQKCLSTPETSVDTTLDSLTPTPLLREWAKVKSTGCSWRDALAATPDVSISFVLVLLIGLTLHLSGVYSHEIHDLLCSLRPSRNDQSHNGCNRVFPSNEQRIGGRDKHPWRAGEMGRR